LIRNAIKSSPNYAKIELVIVTEGRNVVITVRDNGPGIPNEELESIFAPFGATRSAGAEHGTGVWLATSKSIVENHGGKIWAENAVEGGTVFHVLLPQDVDQGANV
jgi:signal transduction histidine kinase